MSEKKLEGEQEQKLETSKPRKPFTEPKLTFIEPKLTKYDNVTKMTSSFLGAFSPSSK